LKDGCVILWDGLAFIIVHPREWTKNTPPTDMENWYASLICMNFTLLVWQEFERYQGIMGEGILFNHG